LGLRETRQLGFADQRLDTLSLVDLITPLERVVREVRPAVVYCQFGGDANRDHELLFRAALVATRPIEPYIEAVYAFDTASSTEWGYPRAFVPDTWIDISETLEQKLCAMACYESELREYPHPRSLDPLRRLKIDELPQLVNVLRGEMSLVGPRPQHPDIVRSYYAPEHGETLRVRPGLASPGSLYDSTHGEPLVGSADPERAYAERLLPLVLSLDRVYVRRASLWCDATIVGRTLMVLAASLFGRRTFPEPPEINDD